MGRAILLTALITTLGIGVGRLPAHGDGRRGQTSQQIVNLLQPPVKVTIGTVGSSFTRPTDTFKVGDQILVTITMSNTSTAPLDACISANLYQNLPRLTKDGVLVPYMRLQSFERLNAERNHTCENDNLPQTLRLTPNVATLADWLVLVDSRTRTGAEAWYESLLPGRYELSLQRRLACCLGPMIQSDKVSFVVVP